MSDANPYQSPENLSVPERPLMAQAALTDVMLRFLKDASPWLRFLGIMGFIGSGFMILSGLSMLLITIPVAMMQSVFPGFPEIFQGVGGFVYIATGLIGFFPALFTYRFGAKIRSYMFTNSEAELELAFKNNKALWKLKGILAIVGLAFVPLAIIGGIVALVSFAIP